MAASELAGKIQYELRWVDNYLGNVATSGNWEGEIASARDRLGRAQAAFDELRAVGPAGLDGDRLQAFQTFPASAAAAEGRIAAAEKQAVVAQLDRDADNWRRRFERAQYNGNDSIQRFADDFKSVAEEIIDKHASDPAAAAAAAKFGQILMDAYELMEENERKEKEAAAAKREEALSRAADEISYCEDTIKTAFGANACTFSTTGTNYTRQPWFSCRDCPSGFQFCASCFKVCHGPGGRFADHEFSEYNNPSMSDMYCDCGHGDNGGCDCLDESLGAAANGNEDNDEPAEAEVDGTAAQEPDEPEQDDGTAAAAASGDFATTAVALPPLPAEQPGLARASQPTAAKPAWKLAVPSGAARRTMTAPQIEAIEAFNSAAQYANEAFAEASDCASRLYNRDESADWLSERIENELGRAEDRVKIQLGDQIKRMAGESKFPALAQESEAAVRFLRTYAVACRTAWTADAKKALGYNKVSNELRWYKEALESADEQAKQEWTGATNYSDCFSKLEDLEEVADRYGLREKLLGNVRSVLEKKNAKHAMAKFKAMVAKMAEEEWIQYQLPSIVDYMERRCAGSAELAEAKAIMAKINGEEEAKRQEQEAAERDSEAEGQRQWDEMVRRQKEELLEAYGDEGGSVTVGNKIWTFEGSNGNFVSGSDRFSWNGVELEVVDAPSFPDLRGKGIFTSLPDTAARIKWESGRRLFGADYVEHDDGSFRFAPDHEYGAHIGDTRFDWNGQTLKASETYRWKYWDAVTASGKVPAPLVMFAGLLGFLDYRSKILSKQHICRSALFSEGTPARVCSDCKSDRCVVCRDSISFLRDDHIAEMDKSCASFHGSNCARCGGFGANYAAYYCDGCLFDHRGYCCRNTRKL
ncbi:hypothetical protein DFJ74DRAFT_749224 [Hyaloraphidium curvatum]|nr:hypothetical protein DFJ74DRAFT_749224 [Hyaloraphidium curvatum]